MKEKKDEIMLIFENLPKTKHEKYDFEDTECLSVPVVRNFIEEILEKKNKDFLNWLVEEMKGVDTQGKSHEQIIYDFNEYFK